MKRIILLSVSILLISLAYSFAEVPCKINYQGRLIKDNVPVDGTKKMVFSIYNDAVAVTPPLWTSGEVDVTVHNGLFRYVLDLSSIDWAAGETLYLEVKVETDILTPREELSAYPYAINSHLLEGATKGYFINTSGDSQTKQGNLNIMGNVGIGTASPKANYKLHVDGGSDASAVGVYSETTGDLGIGVRGTATGVGGDGVRGTATGFGGIGVRGRSIDPSSGRAVYGSAYGGVGGWFTSDTGYGLIVESGNVGIGTTNPGEKLTVTGTIESTTGGVKFPDGTLQTTAAEGGVFGSWTDKDSANNTLVKNAVYKATTDGFVTAYITAFAVDVYGYTDSSNSPTTLRFIASGAHAATGNPKGSFTMPVRKGDYWKITSSGTPNRIYWLPIGSGVCERQ